MPSQFNRLVHLSLFSGERARFLEFVPLNYRMQSEYAQEFVLFKPDKKLKWLYHLGTAQLEIELGDRKLEVDVPLLEAAFIELFSQKRNFLFTLFLDVLDITDWPIFLSYLGSRRPHRSPSLKALSIWVDHGILIEDPEFTFNLLEKAGLGDSGIRERDLSTLGMFMSLTICLTTSSQLSQLQR